MQAIDVKVWDDSKNNGKLLLYSSIVEGPFRIGRQDKKNEADQIGLIRSPTENSQLEQKLEYLQQNRPARPMYTVSARDHEQPANAKIALAGNPHKLGDEVARGYLSCLTWVETVHPMGWTVSTQPVGKWTPGVGQMVDEFPESVNRARHCQSDLVPHVRPWPGGYRRQFRRAGPQTQPPAIAGLPGR